MKRTLTAAAAVVAGSAGVVGFAGSATAAETTPLPTDNLVHTNLSETIRGGTEYAFRLAGGVLPVEQPVTERSSVVPMRGYGFPDLVARPVNGTLGAVAGDHSVRETVREVGSVLPVQPRDVEDTVGEIVGDTTGSPEQDQAPDANPVQQLLPGSHVIPGEPGQPPAHAPAREARVLPSGGDLPNPLDVVGNLTDSSLGDLTGGLS